MSERIIPLLNGVDAININSNNRFNTTLISFNFYLPLKKENMAVNALLPFVLSTCCDEYKTPMLLNRRLCELYGARLSASVNKTLDTQHIRLSISTIDDRFAYGGESVVKLSAELLASLIFAPSFKDGMFCQEDLSREKRKCKERILSQINDKRSYTRRRLLAEMFGEHPYGLNKYGEIEDVEKITVKDLTNAWERMLRESYVRVIISSGTDHSEILDSVKAAFSAITRHNITDAQKYVDFTPTYGKTVTEEMDIIQGKVAMGFTSKLKGDTKTAFALNIMCDLFGGGTYSKLFKNVREQMSLCYYCSAAAVRHLGFVLVESGVDPQNKEALIQQVLKQLEALKNGDFSDQDINASKLSIADTLKSYSDSQSALDNWYAARLLKDDFISPEQVISILEGVTREQIISAAKGVELCTVYCLMPKEVSTHE